MFEIGSPTSADALDGRVMGPSVELKVEAGIAVLTLNDVARKNAMSPELGDALQARVKELQSRTDVRVAVLTGAGGSFSAGGDLAMLDRLRSLPFEEARRFMLSFYGRYLSVLDLPVPVIAAIEGPAIGAGLCVALACDVVFVAENSKLALNFVQLGLHPGMGATYLVPRKVGAQRAAELLLTGRRFEGKEAQTLGLALEALPPEQVLPRAMALAQSIASAAPLSVRALRKGLAVDRAALQAALEHEALAQAESYGSADLGEGLDAAKERRAPKFMGR